MIWRNYPHKALEFGYFAAVLLHQAHFFFLTACTFSSFPMALCLSAERTRVRSVQSSKGGKMNECRGFFCIKAPLTQWHLPGMSVHFADFILIML